jgi:hypothetical protein
MFVYFVIHWDGIHVDVNNHKNISSIINAGQSKMKFSIPMLQSAGNSHNKNNSSEDKNGGQTSQ